MDGHNLEFEDLFVAQGLCLTFHSSAFLVSTLKGSMRDRKIINGSKASTGIQKGFSQVLSTIPQCPIKDLF